MGKTEDAIVKPLFLSEEQKRAMGIPIAPSKKEVEDSKKVELEYNPMFKKELSISFPQKSKLPALYSKKFVNHLHKEETEGWSFIDSVHDELSQLGSGVSGTYVGGGVILNDPSSLSLAQPQKDNPFGRKQTLDASKTLPLIDRVRAQHPSHLSPNY